MEYRIAAWHEERERCKHHGGPRSECADDERDWFAQRTICQPEAQLRAAMRMFEALHTKETGKLFHDGTFQTWSSTASTDTPFKYDDGVRFFMSPVELAPWDDWTTDGDASPVKPEGWGESTAEDQSPD